MKKSYLPGPSCSRSHQPWLPRGNVSAPRENQTVSGMGVGAGSHDTHLNNSVFICLTGRLCGAGASAGRALTRTGQWPLRFGARSGGAGPHVPPTPALHRPRPQEPLPLTGPLGCGHAQDPRPGPQTPSTIPLRSSGSPWRAERLTAVTRASKAL